MIAQVFVGDVAFDAAGLWLGLAAAVLVGAFAGWREWSRISARQAWHGPAMAVPRSRFRGAVRVLLLAVAAGCATASVVGLTGASGTDAAQATAPDSILLALDISRSMDATDVPPSRQAAARAWLARLVDRASPRAVGLVLFAGEPLLTCPLTSISARCASRWTRPHRRSSRCPAARCWGRRSRAAWRRLARDAPGAR